MGKRKNEREGLRLVTLVSGELENAEGENPSSSVKECEEEV